MRQASPNLSKLLEAAAAAQSAGRLDEVERLAREALEVDPGHIPAIFLLGATCARRGDHSGAIEHLNRVLEWDPQSYGALISLASVYREVGRLEDAIATGKRAVDVGPREANAHNGLGRSYLAARRLGEAAVAFERAIALEPRFAPAYFNLGKTRQLEGRDAEAAKAFAAASQRSPALDYLLAYGHMLLILCEFDTALACAQTCLNGFPNSAAAHLLMCGALIGLDRYAEADAFLQNAVRLDPEGKEVLQIAIRQRPLGYVEEANANLRRAIERNPRMVSAYDSLMQNMKVTEADRPLVEQMRKLLDQGELSQTELVSVHYGLGKAREDLGQYAQAMAHYDEANRISRDIKFGEVQFDTPAYAAHIDRLVRLSAELAKSGVPEASESELPILIVGMMRSGTTLSEQILSSHPEIAGAGEQLFWSRNWTQVAVEGQPSGEALASLGRQYIEHLQGFGPSSKRVTDKMPGNCMFAGLIHLALPNARFIHMRRRPIDNCLSIWATPNHMPHEGGNRKADIVFVYRQYMRIMEAWRAALPPGRLLEIDYEDLVADAEVISRGMVEFCGLEWDDACLRPEQNKRLVATPSAWQVRQPVYRSSVDRWRRLEGHLGEFEELLELRHPAGR